MGIAKVRYNRKTNSTEPIRWVQIFIVSLWLRKRLWKNKNKSPTSPIHYRMKDKPYNLSWHSHYHATTKDLRRDHLWTNQVKACDYPPCGDPTSKRWKISLDGCQSFLTLLTVSLNMLIFPTNSSMNRAWTVKSIHEYLVTSDIMEKCSYHNTYMEKLMRRELSNHPFPQSIPHNQNTPANTSPGTAIHRKRLPECMCLPFPRYTTP